MTKREVLKRYIVLVIGLFAMAFGISLSTKVNLGTSPISCVPYVLSLGLPFTMGEITIAMHILFIVMQIVLLKRDFQPMQLLQLLVAVIFGLFTDFTLFLVSGLSPSNYVVQWIMFLISCMIIAFGVNLEVKANVIMLSGEGLILAISRVFHKEFGKVKVFFDSSLVTIGVVISFCMLHELQGIREGTIVAALLVGIMVKFYSTKLKFIDHFLEEKAIGTSTEIERCHHQAQLTHSAEKN